MEYKEYVKKNSEKERSRKQVLGKYNRKVEADRVTMHVIVALGDSLYDINQSEQHEDVSMMVVETDVQVYDSLFVLMKNPDEDEDDKVTLLDIK